MRQRLWMASHHIWACCATSYDCVFRAFGVSGSQIRDCGPVLVNVCHALRHVPYTQRKKTVLPSCVGWATAVRGVSSTHTQKALLGGSGVSVTPICFREVCCIGVRCFRRATQGLDRRGGRCRKGPFVIVLIRFPWIWPQGFKE